LKILLLSFYFKPDLSAGSFRINALVDSLLKILPEGSEIHVVTTLPNRYSSFSPEALEEENSPGLTVKRVKLPTHQSGMVDQSRAFLAYGKYAMEFVNEHKYDLVFATSSRLMTAVLGAFIARKQNTPLYLDIRDIFVDTIKDTLPRRLSWIITPVFSLLERWVILKAGRLNVVSAGFLSYFETRYPDISKVVFTNGIDDEFLGEHREFNRFSSDVEYPRKKPIEVVYAGNMGEGQGLHNIIPDLAKKLEGIASFRLIGGGGRLRQLEDAILQANCSNVIIEPPVARAELIHIYEQADVLFLHLNDYDAFRKVLPSKLFEYGASGKPIWAGVSGYAAEFIKTNLNNAKAFSPCDLVGALDTFNELQIIYESRDDFIARFSRKVIMDKMAKDMVSIVNENAENQIASVCH
jgi:hypothetical protein